jgi:GNAT superfamily N-acetyltransferase
LGFLLEHCSLNKLTDLVLKNSQEFDCGNLDLNDFFSKDACLYNAELLGKTYCFIEDDNTSSIVCAFTVANDSIKKTLLPRAQDKRVSELIPFPKRAASYPAVLIGRLGVNVNYKRKGIGKELMNFLKSWFGEELNKTGCRFIVVDAYNEQEPLAYYHSCGFKFLFRNEEEEREYTKEHLPEGTSLNTRLMYFDLILLK